jgi:hypothetical protein
MLKLESASSKLPFSTVRIECQLRDGSTSTGTAFFLTYQIDEERQLPLLITNKHVISGATIGQFHVHEAMTDTPNEPAPGSFVITLNNFSQRWFMHPDPLVDICVMPFEPLRQQAKTMGKVVFNCSLSDVIFSESGRA